MSKTWYTWLAGAAFVIVVIVGFLVAGEAPDATDDSVKEIVAYYDGDTTALWISLVLELLAGALIVYFGAHLRQALKAAETLAPVILAGAIVIGVALAIDATITVALLDAADDPDVAIAPGAAQALSLLYGNDFMPIGLGVALFASASGLAIVRHGVVPKWLGIVAIVLGVLAFTPAGFVGVAGTALWVGGVSILMALRAKSQSEEQADFWP